MMPKFGKIAEMICSIGNLPGPTLRKRVYDFFSQLYERARYHTSSQNVERNVITVPLFMKSALLFVLAFVGCSTTHQTGSRESVATMPELHHEALLSVLWTQTAVEYAGVTRGAYTLAALQMDEALADSEWTASLEQLATGRYTSLPPAVVLDVDETVLDNSAFQARLIEDGLVYNADLWNDWVAEEKATAVPGALEFTRYAESKGVQVIYLTNRVTSVEQATRNNLEDLGFPVTDGEDGIITKAERPEWRSSNKTPRRAYVAETYRILLLIGDNYGDFSEQSRSSLSKRARSASGFASYWGRKWIVLPNAMYGSWDGALMDYKYGLPETERLFKKRSRLKAKR